MKKISHNIESGERVKWEKDTENMHSENWILYTEQLEYEKS